MAGLASKKSTRLLLSGPEFVSRLAPMKRILCLCPVLTSNCDASLSEEGYERYSIGMAVSDPYLAYAIPIDPKSYKQQSKTKDTDGLYVYKGIGVSNRRPVYWRGMAPTKDEFLEQLGYRDISGLALALPMRWKRKRTELAEMKIDAARGSLRSVLNNFTTPHGSSKTGAGADVGHGGSALSSGSEFDLQCDINDSLTVDEALKMAEDEPEMWEMTGIVRPEKEEDPGAEIDTEAQVAKLTPSIHAAVALNSFLWRTTGGWRNTFA